MFDNFMPALSFKEKKKLKTFHITWDNSRTGDNWKTQ